jgi:protein Mpv17
MNMKRVSDFFARHPRVLSGLTGGVTFALGDVIAQVLEAPDTSKAHDVMGTMGILKHEMIGHGPTTNNNAPSSSSHIPQQWSYLESIRNTRIDNGRVMRTAVYGCVMNGLVLYQWFRVVDKVFGSSMANTRTVLLKMLADQLVYAPFSITVYFGVNCLKYTDTQSNVGSNHLNNSNNDIISDRELSVTLQVDDFIHKMRASFWSTYMADWTVWPAVNLVNFKFIPLHFRPTFVCCAQLCWGTYLSSVANKHKRRSHQENGLPLFAGDSNKDETINLGEK